MKKIKFMLLSLAVLAVVGGTLAFKARYLQDWCSTTAAQVNQVSTCIVQGAAISCPLEAKLSTTIGTDADASYYCTTNTFGGDFTCTSLNAQLQVITTTCGTPTFTTIRHD